MKYLFSKEHFKMLFPSDMSREEIEKTHLHLKKTIIDKINGVLYYNDLELKFENNLYYIVQIGKEIIIESPNIILIDSAYIQSVLDRANIDIDLGNFDSAITKSRTLLEEVFYFAIELKNEIPNNDGKINRLYKQVKELYNMHTDHNADKRVNKLLSGLESIVNSVAEMRNQDGDAHGVGSSRIKIEKHHARLVLSSAVTMSEFIIAIANNSKES